MSEETFFESGQLFKKNFQSRVWIHVLRARLNVQTFRVCVHQKSRDTIREILSPKGELIGSIMIKYFVVHVESPMKLFGLVL